MCVCVWGEVLQSEDSGVKEKEIRGEKPVMVYVNFRRAIHFSLSLPLSALTKHN